MGIFMTSNKKLKCPEDVDYDERDFEQDNIVLFLRVLSLSALLWITVFTLSHAHSGSYVQEVYVDGKKVDEGRVFTSAPYLKESAEPVENVYKEMVDRIVYVEKVKEDDIIVTTTWCDTEREDCYAANR
jgi:hypothetical protein